MDFTNEEKERINQLYGNDFKDITPEDAQLIARWESYKAAQNLEYKAKLDAIQAETKAKLEYATIEHEQAMNNLEALKDAALARLEMVSNGV